MLGVEDDNKEGRFERTFEGLLVIAIGTLLGKMLGDALQDCVQLHTLLSTLIPLFSPELTQYCLGTEPVKSFSVKSITPTSNKCSNSLGIVPVRSFFFVK